MDSLAPHLESVFKGQTLSRAAAYDAMNAMMAGESSPVRVAAFLGALQSRSPAADELVGFAQAMRDNAVHIKPQRSPLLDTCGTGGDGSQSFNFSTAAALVIAGAGVAVAKHGNRAVSSRSGSADVLEALGVPIDLAPDECRESIERTGFGFLFAPHYHPAMKALAPVRREIGVRTVFNLLGPLVNPAGVDFQVAGCYDASLIETYAQVLVALGCKRAIVVHAEDGMDELSVAGATRVCHAEAGGATRIETILPEEVGLPRASGAALRGSTAVANARAIEELLDGRTGPVLDGTLLNAAAGLMLTGVASGWKEAVEAARESISSGAARRVLELQRSGRGIR